MAILRAGPWGNLTDSFQNVPPDVTIELNHYPVNVALNNWPIGAWSAYYETENFEGCNYPSTLNVSASFSTTLCGDFNGSATGIYNGGAGYEFSNHAGPDFLAGGITWSPTEGRWGATWDDTGNCDQYYFAYGPSTPCDPRGTYGPATCDDFFCLVPTDTSTLTVS